MSKEQKPLPAITRLLGYGGLIPFISLAVAIILGLKIPGFEDNTRALLTYGAVIISFLGAVHWGAALSREEPGAAHYIYGVVPSLAAWALLFLSDKIALFGMALVVVAAFVVDRGILFQKLRYQYSTLRIHLTVIVAASLALAGIFT